MSKTEEFFKENATKPTAWSLGLGSYVRFSMQNLLAERDADLVKKLVSKYNLRATKEGSYTTFQPKYTPTEGIGSNVPSV